MITGSGICPDATVTEPQRLIWEGPTDGLVIDDTFGEAMLILHMTKANAKK